MWRACEGVHRRRNQLTSNQTCGWAESNIRDGGSGNGGCAFRLVMAWGGGVAELRTEKHEERNDTLLVLRHSFQKVVVTGGADGSWRDPRV